MAMTWDDVMASPYLKDLPFKIELNKWGRIEMSPTSNQHGAVQVDLVRELARRPGGHGIVQCSIQTADGVRVADVAWLSDERSRAFGNATPFPRAPEICVEVKSPSNSRGWVQIKAGLYLDAGAQEVWIVGLDGERSVIRA